jgi:molecular chaperone DnaJ
MRGRGMPAVRGGARGDHLVSVHVDVPTKLSRRQRELLEEFARMSEDPEEDRSFFERVKEAFKAE